MEFFAQMAVDAVDRQQIEVTLLLRRWFFCGSMRGNRIWNTRPGYVK